MHFFWIVFNQITLFSYFIESFFKQAWITLLREHYQYAANTEMVRLFQLIKIIMLKYLFILICWGSFYVIVNLMNVQSTI